MAPDRQELGLQSLALDGDTGEIVWHYQHMNDHWDLDHPFERLVVDTAVAPDPDEVPWINPNLVPGEVRKVITGIPGKTALVYSIDRETGEFLWARPTVYQNVIQSIDGETGKATENPEVVFHALEEERLICPNMHGGKDWEAGAYSPETGEVLWEVNLGSPVTGYPITYATGGTQYVAVSTGISATTSSFLRLTPELKPGFANNLFVFALEYPGP